MRPSALLYMYRRRLRSQGLQELLAGVGIAIAVALVYTAMLSESSIATSAQRVVRTVVGPASLQLRARGPSMGEGVLGEVEHLQGVKATAPLLEATATIRAAGRRTARVQLAGADLRLAVLDGLAETLPVGALSSRGIGISASTASSLGVGRHRIVTLQLRGRAYRLPVTAVLGPEAAGALAEAPLAVMKLPRMQALAGMPGRISRILVQTEPGDRALVRRELSGLAGARLQVAGAEQDDALLRQALAPSNLASGLFAAIGGLLGFLLAFSAMLLTVADRRRAIAELRVAGARRRSIVAMVLFEALCLAIPACLLGLLAGYLLATGVFHQSTAYLSEAFTLSASTVLAPWQLLAAFAGGVLATLAASTVPLLDLRSSRARDAIYADGGVPGHALGARQNVRLALFAVALLAAASVLWALLPSAAIGATALLALATVLLVPLAFSGALALATGLGERVQRLSVLPLAVASLRATTLRSLALAATGALALFGSIALGGARQSLLSGIDSFAHSYASDAAIWVTNPGDNQAVQTFAPSLAATVAKVPGVGSVSSFHGGFDQLGPRRVWIVARSPADEERVLATQLQQGSLGAALARLRRGGWVVVSQQIAQERHLALGDALALPTPTGVQRLRIAGLTTNLAWPPGVVFMSSRDYERAFATADPTALGVGLRPGANPHAVVRAIAAAVRPAGGLEVALSSSRAKRIESLASAGLGQLNEVAAMLLLAAIVAMAAALASSVWQRRAGLASLRLLGARRRTLQAILLIEAVLMLGAGCLTGALAGVYGQLVIDAFLRHVTGFPIASPTASARPLELLALVLLAGLLVGAIPGWLAVRVKPGLALANE